MNSITIDKNDFRSHSSFVCRVFTRCSVCGEQQQIREFVFNGKTIQLLACIPCHRINVLDEAHKNAQMI